MKTLLIIVIVALCAVGLEAGGQKAKKRLAAEYQQFLFDKNSSGDLDPALIKEKVLFLRDALDNGVVSDTAERKELITKLVDLTQITLCSKLNDYKFSSVIKNYSEYGNIISFVNWQQDEYKKSCVEYNDQEMPWNADLTY